MKKLILVLMLLLVSGLSTSGAVAGDTGFGMAWSTTLGTGNTGDFISGMQFRGVSIEYQKRINSNLLWGLNVGYNVFADSATETRYSDNVQATGRWGNYINTVPIYLSAIYQFGSYSVRDGRFFAAMNAGTAYLEKRSSLGLYAIEDDNWHLAVAPEFGYHLPWDALVGRLSVRYNYLFEVGESEAQSWFEFRIGFGL